MGLNTTHFNETSWGRIYQDREVVVIFGNRFSNRATPLSVLSQSTVIGLQQTHSATVIDVKGQESWSGPEILLSHPQGDALTTSAAHVFLTIATADCLPLLIYSPSEHRIAACHAGWKGIENKIIAETLNTFQSRELRIWIGPHIRSPSFEVHQDVAARLAKASKLGEAALKPHRDFSKAYVDLTAIAIQQIGELGVDVERALVIDERDTFLEPTLASFRRDGSQSGRMISAVALLR